jgi:hypothetical protein
VEPKVILRFILNLVFSEEFVWEIRKNPLFDIQPQITFGSTKSSYAQFHIKRFLILRGIKISKKVLMSNA